MVGGFIIHICPMQRFLLFCVGIGKLFSFVSQPGFRAFSLFACRYYDIRLMGRIRVFGATSRYLILDSHELGS